MTYSELTGYINMKAEQVINRGTEYLAQREVRIQKEIEDAILERMKDRKGIFGRTIKGHSREKAEFIVKYGDGDQWCSDAHHISMRGILGANRVKTAIRAASLADPNDYVQVSMGVAELL